MITSARLRLSPAPQLRVFRGFEVDDVAAGRARRSAGCCRRGCGPAVVRLYDELDTLINSLGHHDDGAEAETARVVAPPMPPVETGALPAWPGPPPEAADGVVARLLELARGKHLRRDAMHAALGNSQLVNRLVGTVAEKIARRGCRLIIGLEGARIRTEVEAALTFHELEAAGARDKGEDPGWAWLAIATRSSYRMSPMFRDGAFVDTMEVASSWERLIDLYHSVRAAIGRHAVVMAHFSHAYADGCSIYFTFAGHRRRRRRAPSGCTTRSGATASRRRRGSAARSATTTASGCSRRRSWPASTARRWRSSRPRRPRSIPTAS